MLRHRCLAGALVWALLAAVPGAAEPVADCTAWRESAPAADLQIAWFPYSSQLRALLDLSSLPRADELTSATLELRARGSDRVLWTQPVALRGGRSDGTYALPELGDGVYAVAAELRIGAECPPTATASREFEQRRFGWEHNRLGEGDELIPPFTPLEVDGRRVRAVLREYALNDHGLPDQITSAGADLLARPAHFRVRVDGSERQPTAESPIRIVRESPSRVRTEASWSAAGLRVRSTGSFEMDGMWLVDLELSGSGERVDQLDLVVPLRSDRALLFNAIADATLTHALGALADRPGVIWTSAGAGRWALSPDWVPYLWVGDEDRGLAWFAESRRDWWTAAGRAAQEIVRRGDAVELVIHFALAPGTLQGRRHIRFGLQATPAKPRPEAPRNWRSWQITCSSPFPAFLLCPLGSGAYWGSETPYGNVYPWAHDYSFLEHLGRVRRGEAPDRLVAEQWLFDREIEDPARMAQARASLLYALAAAAERPDAIALYVNLHGAAWTPEFSVYQDEWRAEPFGDRAGRDADSSGEIKIRASQSWNDYVLWHLDRLLDTGAADGFFFDNTYLKADFNETNGSAYRDERGKLLPGVDLLAMRELLKRAQMHVYRKRGAWLNIAHMSTTPIAPLQTWSGVSADGEWKYGTDDYQDRFPRELLRAASLGAQAGTVSAYLPGLTGAPDPAKRVHLERSLAGLTALHEIRVLAHMQGPLASIWKAFSEFGYGRPDTIVKHYWDRDRSFSLSGADAEALLLARNGKALLLLVSFGDGGAVKLSLNGPGGPLASLRPGGRCRDVEGLRPAPSDQVFGCEVQLARNDFRLVSYESPPDAP